MVQGKSNVFTDVCLSTCGGVEPLSLAIKVEVGFPLFHPKPGRYDTCPPYPIPSGQAGGDPFLHRRTR